MGFSDLLDGFKGGRFVARKEGRKGGMREGKRRWERKRIENMPR